MSLPEYKQIQIEHEDRHRIHYNLEAIQQTPTEKYYAEREYAFGLSLLEQLLSFEEVGTLLVCGVGAGADLHYWLTNLPLRSVLGLDFSIEAIRATQRRVHLNDLPDIVSYMRADFENIPLRDSSVDVGIYVHTLHHALDPAQGFRELWRVSKKGVLLIEPLSTPVTRLFARLGIAQDIEDVGNKVIRFKLDDYLRWVGTNGVAYRSRAYFYYYHPFIYKRLLPIFDSKLGLQVFRGIYRTLDAVLIPLRSKMATVLVKRGDSRP